MTYKALLEMAALEPVHIKLLLRIECTIVSFHPEAPDDEVEDSTNAPGRGGP